MRESVSACLEEADNIGADLHADAELLELPVCSVLVEGERLSLLQDPVREGQSDVSAGIVEELSLRDLMALDANDGVAVGCPA